MFPELRKRAQKTGQPPGTAVYTGNKKLTETRISVLNFTADNFHETNGKTLEECLPPNKEPGITWINIEGLNNTKLIEQLCQRYNIHPLTLEDILNVSQRPKVEEFENYVFLTLKILLWRTKRNTFSSDQLSLVFGNDFVLSFQERGSTLFNNIRERLCSESTQRLRQQGADYLVYRLTDTVIDYYFVILEELGYQVEKVEELIVNNPQPQNTRTIYRLKRQIISLRKAIWPVREMLSHLLQMEDKFVTPFTRVYLRDLYDHIVQAIDTIETFRDMLSGMLDMYLSSLTNRMNEVMKTLTIIATIFIPITFIASVFGMNFDYMPELHWRWAYFVVLGIMFSIALSMIYYFWRKKWL